MDTVYIQRILTIIIILYYINGQQRNAHHIHNQYNYTENLQKHETKDIQPNPLTAVHCTIAYSFIITTKQHKQTNEKAKRHKYKIKT